MLVSVNNWWTINVNGLYLIISIAVKHRILPENIQEFDDNTTLILFIQKYGELEIPIWNLENLHRRIDGLDILFVVYDFPKWQQIREIFGMAIGILTT